MKTLDLKSLIIGGLLTMVIVAFMLVATTSSTPRAWEYKSFSSVSINDQELNKLGDEGWEVVGYTFTPDRSGNNYKHYILKRAKRSNWDWKFWK